MGYRSTHFYTSALDEWQMSVSHFGHLVPGERDLTTH
jgi:hypothetical protein